MARVLVVDDERAIRELLTFVLTGEGYEVLTLSDGTAVLDVLADSAEPCVVLLDLMMPRTDGWAVCRALREQPHVLARHQIALMSAALLSGEEPPAPAAALLRKPFELDQVVELVAGLVARAASLCAETACAGIVPLGTRAATRVLGASAATPRPVGG
jgi:CheY-like chemotaxis protein